MTQAKVGILNFEVGNIRSIHRGLLSSEHAAPEMVTDWHELSKFDKFILPGVGAFASCKAKLLSRFPREELEKWVFVKPVLGICVGMQILFDRSSEFGEAPGLGLIEGGVERIEAPGLQVPHVGWDPLELQQPDDPLFRGLPEKPFFYFTHSFHCMPKRPESLIATCSYGGRVTAAVRKGDLVGTQFHPEKSQSTGITLLDNFCRQ